MNLKTLVKELLQVESVTELEIIQSLWSGYGYIKRFQVNSGPRTVIVKHIELPLDNQHPRGWNTNTSHQRKIKSYQVETAWYKNYNHLCTANSRTPQLIAEKETPNGFLLILEDLDAVGYPLRKGSLNWNEIRNCIHWLANFHATFLNSNCDQLWETGTYWHLKTRPDELNQLTDFALKEAAPLIDQILNSCPYQTLVHGDAKVANFCFSESEEVSALDFQYIGQGIGVKDLAYFIGSCLSEADCEKYEATLLDIYFSKLISEINKNEKEINTTLLEDSWRKLYPYAWTDFHRFLKGWSPGHWKLNSYSEKMAQFVLKDLSQTS